MSALRSILLHLDPSPRCARRLALARQLAALHDAKVTALYACNPMAFSQPLPLVAGAAELLSRLQQLDLDYRDNAKALFDRAESGQARPVAWRELGDEPLVAGVASRALFSDLLVLGQHDPSDPLTTGVPSDFVPSVLLACGRPALVVPYIDVGTSFGQDVLVAWKPTRECARAVTAAIPLLRGARRIHLTLGTAPEASADAAASLEGYLRLHDIRAPVVRHAAVPAELAGEGLLSLCVDVGADLLVMGCYGHGRARELLLGGASRTVLASMTLPVLMAH